METAQLLDGVYLRTLDTGATIDVETRSRRYRLEYLEGDRIRISGHPQWCPAPTLARLWGSRGGSEGAATRTKFAGIGKHACLPSTAPISSQ